MFARVAQWWSIALPRRGSRVRIPSRALNDTKKEISVGYLLFCMFEPCRVRTVGMSPRCSGRRSRTSPGRSATSRALKEIEKGVVALANIFCWVAALLYAQMASKSVTFSMAFFINAVHSQASLSACLISGCFVFNYQNLCPF